MPHATSVAAEFYLRNAWLAMTGGASSYRRISKFAECGLAVEARLETAALVEWLESALWWLEGAQAMRRTP